MTAIELLHAEIGTVSSRQDGSVAFRVLTPELRPSEAGAIMSYHGKACSVFIKPTETPADEIVRVDTERDDKTPSERLRAVIFVSWTQNGKPGDFAAYYAVKMERLIDHIKSKLEP